MLRRIRRYLERVRLTRESLVKMAAAIFGGFFLVSLILPSFLPGSVRRDRAVALYSQEGPAAGEQALAEYLSEYPDDVTGWIELARMRARVRAGDLLGLIESLEEVIDDPTGNLARLLEERDLTLHFDDAAFDVLLTTCPVLPVGVLRAYRDAGNRAEALTRLVGLEDVLAAQIAGGEICLEADAPVAAILYFRSAMEIDPESRAAATGWVRALQRSGPVSAFESALTDPALLPHIDPRYLFEVRHERKEYIRSFIPLWQSEYERITPGLLFNCIVVGGGWALLVFHMGFGWFWRRPIQWLAVLAIVAGWLSADLTLASVIVTDDWVGKDFRSGVSFSILYSLLIGFREEIIKLLFFLPFVPYLVRMGSEVQAIVIASLVGLGFAVNENAGYYLASGGGAIIGRFITANFFHLALTGYVGYFLVRAIRRKGEDWGGFYGALAKVIGFHAIYDLFLIEPRLAEYSIFSMILFILLSQQYLRLFFHIRPHRVHRVSLTRIFVASLATVIGMHYVYLSTRLGVGEALWYTLGGVLGIAIITFMYFQEFDERVA